MRRTRNSSSVGSFQESSKNILIKNKKREEKKEKKKTYGRTELSRVGITSAGKFESENVAVESTTMNHTEFRSTFPLARHLKLILTTPSNRKI